MKGARVLVLGATGFVGRALVQALVSSGEHIRAASRRDVEGAAADLEWVRCDMRRPETLPSALAGIETVYSLVHSMGEGGAAFRDVEHASARRGRCRKESRVRPHRLPRRREAAWRTVRASREPTRSG